MDTANFRHQKDNPPHINVTPLIDVLLVLLIIFMVVSPIKPSRFKTQVPSENKTDANASINTLVVTINKNLELELNREKDLGTIDEPNKLTTRLNNIFAEGLANGVYKQDWQNLSDTDRIEKTVFIKAPRSIGYGNVAKVIDSIKGAGANPIGLQIDDLGN